MTTASDRVRAYKAEHPHAAAPEIARELGLRANAVRVILWRMGLARKGKPGRTRKPRCEHCGGIVR